MKNEIFINGRFLTQQITGVQRFGYEITKRLSQKYPVRVVCPPGFDGKIEFPVEKVGINKGHLWEQLDLPFYLRAKKSPLLLNLSNTGPVLYNNQIATHHDITYVRHSKSFSLKFRLLYKLVCPSYLNGSRAVITVSEFSKGEIASYYKLPKDKINVVPNGVDLNYFKPNISTENFFLLVSSPNLHKNFEAVIQAFLRSPLRQKFRLKIVGSVSPSFNRIRQKADPSIAWLGRVTDDELRSLYQRAYAFVFPSLYEGFGIPPLEAQACGCPVLASNAASLPEVLRDSAFYFDPKNIAEISEKMLTLASDADFRNSLIQKGFANCARYSWSNSCEKIENIIRSFIC